MVQFAIKRFGKNQLQVAITQVSDEGWSNEAINHYLYALKAKAICIAGLTSPLPHFGFLALSRDQAPHIC